MTTRNTNAFDLSTPHAGARKSRDKAQLHTSDYRFSINSNSQKLVGIFFYCLICGNIPVV